MLHHEIELPGPVATLLDQIQPAPGLLQNPLPKGLMRRFDDGQPIYPFYIHALERGEIVKFEHFILYRITLIRARLIIQKQALHNQGH